MKKKLVNKKKIKIVPNFYNHSINKIYKKKFILYKKHCKKMANVSSLITKKTYFLEVIKILINGKFRNKFGLINIIKNTFLIVKIPHIYFYKQYNYALALVTNDPNKCGFINAVFLDNVIGTE